MAKDLAIVLSSGSVNSAVVAALAAQKFRPIFIHAELGQSPAARLKSAYDAQVGFFKPYREHTLPMTFLAPLTQADAPAAQSDPRVAAQVSPLLRSITPLIALASRYASLYEAAAIYLGLRVGSQSDDLARATEYVQIWNEMLQIPCGMADVEVVTPLLELDSPQVIDVGVQVSAPLERTWSCLEDGFDPCWACRGCRSRESAFLQSGKTDPMRVVRKL